MNGFCFIVHVFCMEQKKKHTQGERRHCVHWLECVRANTDHLASRRCCHGRSRASTKRKKKVFLTARSDKKFPSAAFLFHYFLRQKAPRCCFCDGLTMTKAPNWPFDLFTNSQAERFNCHVWWWRTTGRTWTTSLRLGVLQPAAPPDQSQCNS